MNESTTEVSTIINDIEKEIPLHGIGLSSSSENEEEETLISPLQSFNSKSSVASNDWLTYCIEIREIALRSLKYLGDVPINENDQQKYIKQLFLSLVERNKELETENKQYKDVQKHYDDLKTKYNNMKGRIKQLESKITELEKLEKARQSSFKEQENTKATDYDIGEINSSIDHIAKLVESQTASQQKFLDAVKKSRKDRSKNQSKETEKRTSKGKLNASNDEYTKKERKTSQHDDAKPSRHHRHHTNSHKNFSNHMHQPIDETNEMQSSMFDICDQELSLTKLSMLNDSLLKEERKFYKN